jgi:copper oxidase (laccase) domain-containing protein
MIGSDQPTIFGEDVIAVVSSKSDGNLRFNRGDDTQTLQNRLAFFQKVGIDPNDATLVQVSYADPNDFARYQIVVDDHKGEGILDAESDTIADALVTTAPGHALFLPLADCVGVILYDTDKHILMVSHVGRHSAEVNGAMKSVQYLKDNFATNPKDIKVWLSPAVGKATYPIHAKAGKGLHEVIREQLNEANVLATNIEASPVDTAQSDDYFSHSQFILGERDLDGRFAIVAQMREQGEPAF